MKGKRAQVYIIRIGDVDQQIVVRRNQEQMRNFGGTLLKHMRDSAHPEAFIKIKTGMWDEKELEALGEWEN